MITCGITLSFAGLSQGMLERKMSQNPFRKQPHMPGPKRVLTRVRTFFESNLTEIARQLGAKYLNTERKS